MSQFRSQKPGGKLDEWGHMSYYVLRHPVFVRFRTIVFLGAELSSSLSSGVGGRGG